MSTFPKNYRNWGDAFDYLEAIALNNLPILAIASIFLVFYKPLRLFGIIGLIASIMILWHMLIWEGW